MIISYILRLLAAIMSSARLDTSISVYNHPQDRVYLHENYIQMYSRWRPGRSEKHVHLFSHVRYISKASITAQ